jgi:hypothetical protein
MMSRWAAYAGQRPRVAGQNVLVSAVDTDLDLYDSTGAWRERAMAGVLHSGTFGARSAVGGPGEPVGGQ